MESIHLFSFHFEVLLCLFHQIVRLFSQNALNFLILDAFRIKLQFDHFFMGAADGTEAVDWKCGVGDPDELSLLPNLKLINHHT